MSNSAIITPVLAAGATASPYPFLVTITQRLCQATCAGQTPVFAPTFSLVGYSEMGTGVYAAIINVQGIISYVPCRENCCCTRSQVINQDFSVSFASGTAPTSVTISQGTPTNSVAAQPCQECSKTFVSETIVTLDVTTASEG